MALATLVSRVTGFARIVVLAAILGAALSSAFTVANQLPNLVAALVLEATFTAIFVPVLARAEQDDADGGAAFVRRLVTLATAVLLATTLLSVAAAPLLVQLMLGRSPQVNEPLTIAFAYLLLPQVIFYGLSSVFMAILNTRNVFGPPAWAPVVNNVVAIATLGAYLAAPGQLSVDPVQMGNAKLLVLGIGTTLGVFAQTAVLLVAIRRQRISLRPLWGIDDRLKRFGTMAAAMVFYVLISQIGLIVTNQIASTAAASGPAIYNYTWLVLMLPFGMIGVTVLTVVMPRLSRNAAADDTAAVLADLSLATRLTMITLIPTVAFMTVGGSAMGSALFAYGHFGDVDAGYLGAAIALSAFTLLPYSVVLLQLRVFYAREQPWIPIAIIVIITTVKIAASLVAPHLTEHPDLVAGYLGLANGLGFLAGAVAGYVLLRNALRPAGGHLLGVAEVRTILVAITASLLAGLVAYVVDVLLGMQRLTAYGGGAGSLLRLFVLAVIMLPIVAVVMVRAQVPEAQAALAVFRRWIGATRPVEAGHCRRHRFRQVSRCRRRASRAAEINCCAPASSRTLSTGIRRSGIRYENRPERATGEGLGRGPGMTDGPSDSTSAKAVSDSRSSPAGGRLPPRRPHRLQVGTVTAPEISDPAPTATPSPDPTSRPRLRRRRSAPRRPRESSAATRRTAPGPRRQHRPRPLPVVGVPRRRAAPAVLAGAGYRAESAGGADLRGSGRDAARRRGPRNPGSHHAAEPHRQTRHRPGPRRRPHRRRWIGGRRMGPGWLAAGSRRHLAVGGGRSARDADPGRCGRGRPPRRRRAVDRPSQPGAGQHRGRRGAGLPRDDPGRQPRRRHPRYRRGVVCAAGQSVAAAGVRRTQRDGAGTARSGRSARRAQFDRRRHPLPDFRGSHPLASNWMVEYAVLQHF